jgi:hypothetical protein
VLRDRCQAAFLELEKLERALVRQAFTGQGYDTLWQRE